MTTPAKKRLHCLGFGEFENVCPNSIAGSGSPFWCERCEVLRLKHIDKRFEEIAKTFLRRAVP